jgi:hypothetical protein
LHFDGSTPLAILLLERVIDTSLKSQLGLQCTVRIRDLY